MRGLFCCAMLATYLPQIEHYDRLVVDADPPQREAFPFANVRAPFDESDDKFHIVENVPVFAEHTTTAKDGRTLEFNYVNLKKVCDCCNRRIQSRGNFATIIIGHSPDPALVRAGKLKNPPAVGFAGPFRMGLLGFGPDQVWAILARMRFFLKSWPEAQQYPNRSPELWLMPSYDEMFLDPIALLGAETPRLDLGLMYSAMLHVDGRSPVMVEKYSAVSPSATSVVVPSHLSPTGGHHANEHRTLQYQGEDPMAGSTDEIVQAVVTGLEALDWVQWVKSKMQAEQAPAAMGSAPAPDVNAPPAVSNDAVPDPQGAAAQPPATGPDPNAPPARPEGLAESPPPATPPAATPPAAAAPPAGDKPPVEERSKSEKEKNEAGMPYDAASGGEAAVTPPAVEGGGDPFAKFLDALAALIAQFKGGGEKPAEKPAAAEPAKENFAAEVPAAVKVEGGAEPCKGMNGKESYSLDQIPGLLKNITDQIGQERSARINVERRLKLNDLRDQGFTIDPAALFETMNYSKMSDDEFGNQLKLIENMNGRAPLGTMVQTFDDGSEHYAAGRPGAGAERAKTTDEHRSRARSIAEANSLAGKPASECDYGTILDQVKQGKI